jgi:hypothetical protein
MSYDPTDRSMTTSEQTESTTLYLNNDARLGGRVIGTEEEFSLMLPDGMYVSDYDVFEFTTLAELLAHLMDGSVRVTTVEAACREFLSLTGSELVTKIA